MRLHRKILLHERDTLFSKMISVLERDVDLNVLSIDLAFELCHWNARRHDQFLLFYPVVLSKLIVELFERLVGLILAWL